MRKTTTLLIGAALLLLCGGCYRYVPTELSAVPPGSEVRAILSGDGIEAMRGTFGPQVTKVDGPLAYWGQEGLGVTVDLTVQREGFPPTNLTETVQLLPHYYDRVELRQLDGKRTAGFTVGVIAAMAGSVIAARTFGGASEDPGQGGDPDPDLNIIFRIPLRFGGR